MRDAREILDDAILAELSALGHELDRDVLGEVVSAYRKVVPDLLRDLEEAAARRAFEPLVRAAHALKGSSAQIGAVGVRDAARAIEEAARGERAEALGPLVAQCREAWTQADAKLAELVEVAR
ncbi:MAG: Hpt domain-containing protein [Myxococcota bacterium]